jgi:hypothetical protein
MIADVGLGGLVAMVRGMEMVAMGKVRVMRGLFVSTGIVMFRRFLVMTHRVFVVLRRFPMMV